MVDSDSKNAQAIGDNTETPLEETEQVKQLKAQLEAQLEKYPVALDPEQVAEVINCSRRYVDQLIDDGKLPYFVLDDTKTYKQKRVLKVNLMAFMINQATK